MQLLRVPARVVVGLAVGPAVVAVVGLIHLHRLDRRLGLRQVIDQRDHAGHHREDDAEDECYGHDSSLNMS